MKIFIPLYIFPRGLLLLLATKYPITIIKMGTASPVPPPIIAIPEQNYPVQGKSIKFHNMYRAIRKMGKALLTDRVV